LDGLILPFWALYVAGREGSYQATSHPVLGCRLRWLLGRRRQGDPRRQRNGVEHR